MTETTDEPLLIRGDARALPLPDASVDLIVTSPPYFGLRSYQDGGEHYDGQIGAEATPAEFIAALIACTREWMRVLKPTGSIFVNLGDKYDKRKSLAMLPERYRIAAVDELGLIARAVLVWSKPNGLPESVTDRVRRSHEDWVHLTKAPRYFAAVDEIREPAVSASRVGERRSNPPGSASGQVMVNGERPPTLGHAGMGSNPLGKLPGSVWEIATQPLKVPAELGVDHFAAFPMEWPRRLILGWSPAEVCTVCGEGRRPVTNGKAEPNPALSLATRDRTSTSSGSIASAYTSTLGRDASAAERTITGYACACPDTTAPSTPGVVLDPFGGTGTTALVATMHGRRGISVDLSADYCRLAQWRVNDPKQRKRATVAKVKPLREVVEPEPIVIRDPILVAIDEALDRAALVALWRANRAAWTPAHDEAVRDRLTVIETGEAVA